MKTPAMTVKPPIHLNRRKCSIRVETDQDAYPTEDDVGKEDVPQLRQKTIMHDRVHGHGLCAQNLKGRGEAEEPGKAIPPTSKYLIRGFKHTIAPPRVIQTLPEVMPRPTKLRKPKLRCNSYLWPDTLTPTSRLGAWSEERAEEEYFSSYSVGFVGLSERLPCSHALDR